MACWEVREGSPGVTPTKRRGVPVSPMLSPAHDAALLRSLASLMDDSPAPARDAPPAALAPMAANANVAIPKPRSRVDRRGKGGDGASVIVEFKLGRRGRAACSPELAAQLQPSTYVVLQLPQGKGEDTAMCVCTQSLRSRGGGVPDAGTVLRIATAEDCAIINTTLPLLEETAMQECQQLIHFLHLPFVCIDAEYTFDCKHVRIHYLLAPQQCTTIIPNLPRLQRELSFTLKARVTLEQAHRALAHDGTAGTAWGA